MPQTLGVPFVRNQPQVITAGGAIDRTVLLSVHANETSSGGGAGKDYVVIFGGYVGEILSGVNANMITRVGMRVGGVDVPQTYSSHSHSGSPLYGDRVGCPFLGTYMIRDMPTGAGAIEIVGHHQVIAGIGFNTTAIVDGLWMLVIDLVRLGGSRSATGWSGSKVVYQEGYPVSGTPLAQAARPELGTLLLSMNLPGISTDDRWLLVGSQQMHPKRVNAVTEISLDASYAASNSFEPPAVRHVARTPAVGNDNDINGREYYCTGAMRVSEGARTVVELRGRSVGHTGSTVAGGGLLALKIDSKTAGAEYVMDGLFYDQVDGIDLAAIGNFPFQPPAFRSYDSTAERDMTSWFAMSWATTRDQQNPTTFARGMISERYGEARDPATCLGAYVQGVDESVPVHTFAAQGPSLLVPKGSVPFSIDRHRHVETSPGSLVTGDTIGPVTIGMQLSDFGEQADPEPPTLTDVVIIPDKEAPDLSQVTPFAVEPSGGVLVPLEDDQVESRSPTGYVFRWGGPVRPAKRHRIEWADLDEVGYVSIWPQLVGVAPKTVKWTPPFGSGDVPMVLIPGTARTDFRNGLRTVSVEAYELQYFG